MSDLIQNAETAAEIIMNFKNYCTNGQTLVIPYGVEFISGGVFTRDSSPYYSTHLMHVVFPPTLREIGYRAFYHQTYLTEIRLNSGITTLASESFAGCSNLEYIHLPNTLTNCSAYAFTPTSNLVDVELGQNFNCNLSTNVDFTLASLSVQILVNMLTNLKDRTGEYAYTLKLGTANLNKLTNEQKAIAINKNWNLT